jgi:hypothetical protein
MGQLEDALVAHALLRAARDSSRRRADIETSLDAARKSACATRRLIFQQDSQN